MRNPLPGMPKEFSQALSKVDEMYSAMIAIRDAVQRLADIEEQREQRDDHQRRLRSV